ncbi:uncharacterized protein PITG_18197 [Phytophthora infestans T30-4]|uniref:Tc1-like transposase DDE domain-containing protein n=1 Tax=Phytophthora infestans (strain T30-4) TaxID=403677 RepID=D0NXL0_PHYIT|nr:uncharacterized protein PITG_18197 [Phytophthora infestans T30-4]EEY67810.1 conserved hypothetical protein [Phytophthora infestans T30-4]|eukprot:XP_002997835.1 conserved hypothetical protein [Phytophthora infestans T30-4]
MELAATKQHAHPNTVFHCFYALYNLGYTRQQLAHVYNKDVRTIGNWMQVYEDTGTFQRANTEVDRKKKPLAYLDEAQAAFTEAHHISISKSSVWRITHDFGLTWKVLERRAMHINKSDVFRFVEELSTVNWSHQNLVFLDEDFSVSVYWELTGLLDYYDTPGTFDRLSFVSCCKDFVYSARGRVNQYPGSSSVWILDGASIHRHPEIIHYLRIFLWVREEGFYAAL